jgi:hypothetical protein
MRNLIFIFSLVLAGFECYPVRKGIIIDEITHMPIMDAEIKFGSSTTLSNASGQFEISAEKCDPKMTITKKNYKPFGAYLSNKNDETTIPDLILDVRNEPKVQGIDKLTHKDNKQEGLYFDKNTC